MKRLIAACMTVAVLAVPAAAAEAKRHISVTGEGRVAAVPDMATLSLGVTEAAPEAGAAMAAAAKAARAIMDRLAAMDIPARDIRTSRVTLSPIWSDRDDGRPRRITGYRAEYGVAVRIRDLARVGPAIDATVQAGGNDFDGLAFSVQDEAPLRDAARQQAVRDAMARAKLLAQAAGVTLGPVVRIDEGGVATPRPYEMRAAAAMSDAMPVAPGEISVTARVGMVFEIAD